MAFSFISLLTSLIPGSRLLDGGDVLALAKMTAGGNPDVVAHAGGIFTGLAPVQYGFTRISAVGTTGDSIVLPPAVVGASCEVYNGGANTMQVFGQQANTGGITAAGDTIVPNNSVTAAAVATGVSQATAVAAKYLCFTAGVWKQFLSA